MNRCHLLLLAFLLRRGLAASLLFSLVFLRLSSETLAQVDKDCSDFTTQSEAQEHFDSIGGSPSNNADYLDDDGDGVVCERLPPGGSISRAPEEPGGNNSSYYWVLGGVAAGSGVWYVRKSRTAKSPGPLPAVAQAPVIVMIETDPSPPPVAASAIAPSTSHPGWPTPSPGQLQELRAIGYIEYLKKDDWKVKADYMKKKARWRCQLIYKHGGRLETHHRTYHRLFHEEPEDLIVLCRECHARHHDKLPVYGSDG